MNVTLEDVKESLKKKEVATLTIGIMFGLTIFLFHNYGIADALIITILAFLSSNILSNVFIKGKRGILQISLFGTQTQPKGYGFIAFFLSIFAAAMIINVITDVSVTIISEYYPDPFKDILIGLALAGLAYLDMNAKFYGRKKT